MNRFSRQFVPALAAGWIVTGAAATHATAQGGASSVPPPTEVRPPAPGDPEKPIFPATYAMGIVLALVAVGATIMPSRRSHQD